MRLSPGEFDRLQKIRKDRRKAENIAKHKKKPKSGPKKHKSRHHKKTDYSWQYKTPQWYELRERIITRDGGRCVACFKESDKLHVHHLLYERGKKIWEVPDYYLVSLCPSCHKKEHSRHFIAPPKHFSLPP